MMQKQLIWTVLTISLSSLGAPVLRDVQPPVARQELVAVPLDAHVFAYAATDLRDLRVKDQGAADVPFVIQQQRRGKLHVTETFATGSVGNLVVRDDNSVLFQVAPPRKPRRPKPPVAMVFDTRLRDFEKRVIVEIGSDGGGWTKLASSVPLYDYTRFMDVRCLRVPLAEHARVASYRVTVLDVSDEMKAPLVKTTKGSGGGEPDRLTVSESLRRRDFRMDGIRFVYQAKAVHDEEPVVRKQAVEIEGIEHEDGKTIVTVRTGGLPVTGIEVAVEEGIFSRRVTIEREREKMLGASARAGRYEVVGQGTLKSLVFRKLSRRDLQINLHREVRASTLRLVIDDGDSPPLHISGVEATTPVYRVVFIAEPGSACRVSYGEPSLAAPKYDTLALRELMRVQRQAIRELELAPPSPEMGPPTVALRDALPRWLNSRGFLVAAGVLVVLGLGFAVAKAVRGIEIETGDKS
ncbi:MAG: hypothetical protein KAI66_15220 [Lentisphaeria bacterium]|nr:hypothetical protein [Lentisphaeria bacterium]